MREVHLGGKRAAGRVALVDDGDWDLVEAFSWHVVEKEIPGHPNHGPYAAARKGRTWFKMHRLITGWPLTDHANGNGLDNQRSNLREATKGQNNANSRKRVGCSSPYKGVTLWKRSGRWYSSIKVNGKNAFLGHFDDPVAAALAYDAAARAHHGEFARPNFGPGGLYGDVPVPPDIPAGAVLLDQKATAA